MWNVCFLKTVEALCWLRPGMSMEWPIASSVVPVKAAMLSVICSALELCSLRFLNLQATD